MRRRGTSSSPPASTGPSGATPARSALLAACLLLAGCDDESDVVRLEFWALGREGEEVRALIPEFERRNPGIRVEVQQIPWTAAHEKLLTAYAGDATPDLAQIGNTWIPEFVALDALAPLGGHVRRSSAIEPGDYFPGIWETNRVEGVVFGIPWYVDTRVLFYRKDLLESVGYPDPPESWEGWLEALRRIKRRAGEDRYAILLPLDEWAQPVILGLQAGAPLLREDGRYGNFRDPRFREAFAFYVRLFREGLAPPVSAAQLGNLYQDFARGYFAAVLSGPWNLGEFRSRLPAELQDDWGTAPLPAFEGEGPGVSLAGGASLAIFRASERQEAAWKLIEYLSAPERQLRFYELTGNLPPRTDAWRDPALDDPRVRAFFEQLQRVRPMPRVPEWEEIATTVIEYAEEAIRGRMTVDEALAALDREVDRILEKRRWMLEREERRADR